MVDKRNRESDDRFRDGEPGEPLWSQDGKLTATLLLDRNRETGEGLVRRDPWDARRRSLGAGLGPSKDESRGDWWEKRRSVSIFRVVRGVCIVLGSSRRVATGPHRPLHSLGFIQCVQSVWSTGRRATADGMGGGEKDERGGGVGGRRRRRRE